MADKLFDRVSRLVVGELDLSNLDMVFKCVKTIKPEPNTLDLSIYNLQESSRDYLMGSGGRFATQKKNISSSLHGKGFAGDKHVCRLEVGYSQADVHQIFLGEIRSCYSMVRGPDIITTLSTGDGDKAIQTSRCAVPHGPQIPLETALRAIVTTLGVGEGNLDLAISRLKTRGITSIYPRGGVAYGSSWKELQSFARSAELEISIQDGALMILDKGKPLEGKAIRIAPNSGLLESPSIDSDGTVTAKCFIIPQLRPGAKVAFDSLQVKGGYRILRCEWSGDTRSPDWFCTISCRKY